MRSCAWFSGGFEIFRGRVGLRQGSVKLKLLRLFPVLPGTTSENQAFKANRFEGLSGVATPRLVLFFFLEPGSLKMPKIAMLSGAGSGRRP